MHWTVDERASVMVDVPQDLLLNLNHSANSTTRARKKLRLRDLAKGLSPTDVMPLSVGHIVVTIWAPVNVHRFDPHNLMPTVKSLIDGFVDGEFLPDDDCSHLPIFTLVAGGGRSKSDDYRFGFGFGEVVSRSVSTTDDDLFSAFDIVL